MGALARVLSTVQLKVPPVPVPDALLVCCTNDRERCEHTNCADSVEIGGKTAAEDEGRRHVLGRVGDGVGLSSLNTTGGVGVDGGREGTREEGSARNNNLEETHVDASSVEIRRLC